MTEPPVQPQTGTAAFTGALAALGRGAASPYVLLVLTMLLWSSSWIVVRAIWQDTTPIALAFWRWATALAVLLPLSGRELLAQRRHIRAQWRMYLLLGVTGIATFNSVVYVALRTTTAINVSMISASTPTLIVIISWLILRETISGRQGLGILVSTGGVLAIVTRGDPRLLLSLSFTPGDLWTLAAMLVWGLYSVLLRHKPPVLSPLAFLATLTLFGVAVMLPFFLAEWWWVGTMRPNWSNVGAVLYMALFASVCAQNFYNRAVGVIGANRAGPFIHLMPAMTTIMAVIVLAEVVRGYHLVGISLILLGIFIASRGRRAPQVHAAGGTRTRLAGADRAGWKRR
ncbi:MAG: DMT family transporter [Candidatus Lambdaproteobacteria bacterium]|nr:DMT family transporter [Candidatus Lambdaproteobacteria bacterium]